MTKRNMIKRKLLADGTLPLTDEEKAEFCKLFMKNRNIKRIYLENGLVYVSLKPDEKRSVVEEIYDKSFPTTGLCTIEESVWLVERFELIKED